MSIREPRVSDFGAVRKLPVQLAQVPVSSLLPSRLRVMLSDPDRLLLVDESGGLQIRAFVALKFISGAGNEVRLLLITHFAAGWLASRDGIDRDLEAYAAGLARERQVTGLLITTRKPDAPSLQFYNACGYARTGNKLMKQFNYL